MQVSPEKNRENDVSCVITYKSFCHRCDFADFFYQNIVIPHCNLLSGMVTKEIRLCSVL